MRLLTILFTVLWAHAIVATHVTWLHSRANINIMTLIIECELHMKLALWHRTKSPPVHNFFVYGPIKKAIFLDSAGHEPTKSVFLIIPH